MPLTRLSHRWLDDAVKVTAEGEFCTVGDPQKTDDSGLEYRSSILMAFSVTQTGAYFDHAGQTLANRLVPNLFVF